MLSVADLQDWADEGDLMRAEIRLLPIVARFASGPELANTTLGNDLSGRLRAFIEGRDLNVEALQCLLADLIVADRSATPTVATTDGRHLVRTYRDGIKVVTSIFTRNGGSIR
jgi:hypothetical protein